MSNVTCLRLIALIYIVHPCGLIVKKTVLTKLKVAYNNSLRRFMGLPLHNSASEMFVNLNIKSFGELLRVFVHGFRSRITISRNFMLSTSPTITVSSIQIQGIPVSTTTRVPSHNVLAARNNLTPIHGRIITLIYI